MLVYTKEPMGYTSLDGKRIYGEYFNYGRFGPTEISYDTFRQYKDILKEVPLTSRWLSEKFNINISDMSFTYTDTFVNMTFDQLIELAKALGIDYIKSHKPSKSEKRALRRAVIRILDNA